MYPQIPSCQPIGVYDYFCARNTGLVYDHVREYRLIVSREGKLPRIYSFRSPEEAEQHYQQDLGQQELDYHYICAVVQQNGFYLEDPQGGICDVSASSPDSRTYYKFYSHSRVAEWDLSNLSKHPDLQLR